MKQTNHITLEEINKLSQEDLYSRFFQICGAKNWATNLINQRPFANLNELKSKAIKAWEQTDESTQLEAFSSHPRIGGTPPRSRSKNNSPHDLHATWSNQEQSQMQSAETLLKEELSALNELYFQKFGFIFIICATGLEPKTMLESLKKRIQNNRETELKTAATEQGKIILLRLEKLCQNP